MKTLVLYYSFTGITRRVSQLLAKELGADIAELTCKAYSFGFLGGLRQAWDVLIGGAPPIEIPKQANEDYGLIIFAGPVWGARPAPPIRSFAKHLKPKSQKFALFLTCGGTSKRYPGEKALDEIVKEMPVAPIATALFKSADIEGDDFSKKISDFADRLRPAQRKT